jgi:arsenite methyltransferase
VKVEATNVEFRLGEIEHLPVADESVDVILSNCVINLSPDKGAVFREAFRALKAGGRLAISDVVATKDMPPQLAQSVEAMTGCVSGSAKITVLETLLNEAGFEDVKIVPRSESRAVIAQCMPGAEGYVVSATIEATKTGKASCCATACCA